MSDIETEMNKYATLIQNECSTISNTFNKLSELYKQMNTLLKKKRNSSEEIFQEEKEKENLYNLKKINNDLDINNINKKLNENKEDKNKEISKTINLSENDKIKNSQRGFTTKTFNENSETILKRGLIKSKIQNQLKYDGVEGKMINGFKILVIFGDYEYYFGPYKSKNFAVDLKNVILNKLDQVSNKWGNCRKLTQEQQDSLSNIFKEIEIVVDEFFNKENNNIQSINNSETNINETNLENNSNKNEKIEKKNLEEEKQEKVSINNEIKDINQNVNINNILKEKEEKNEEKQNNENKTKINEEKNGKISPSKSVQPKSKKIFNKNIIKNNINNSINNIKEKISPLNSNNIIQESNEKSIKKELNILNYLNDEDYENDNQNQLKKNN